MPFSLLEAIQDQSNKPSCIADISTETLDRIFINILMATLTTDYKKDQVHLPEILKRLRL